MPALSFTATPEIKTPRLLLREPTAADLPDLLSISFYNGKAAADLAEAAHMLAQIQADCRQGNTLHWAVVLQPENTLIGTCGFYRGFKNQTGEIGYVLREEWRGQGYMSEAVAAFISFGFEQLGLRQLFARTDPDNRTSIAVLLRQGFREVPSEEPRSRKFVLVQV